MQFVSKTRYDLRPFSWGKFIWKELICVKKLTFRNSDHRLCRVGFRMLTLGALITCLLSLLSAIAITPLFLLLNSFLASILPYKKNLFTYLDQFFIRVALFRVYAGVGIRDGHVDADGNMRRYAPLCV